MTHGWGSCQGEGRQGHTGQGQADRGRQEEVGSAEEGGAKLVSLKYSPLILPEHEKISFILIFVL